MEDESEELGHLQVTTPHGRLVELEGLLLVPEGGQHHVGVSAGPAFPGRGEHIWVGSPGRGFWPFHVTLKKHFCFYRSVT